MDIHNVESQILLCNHFKDDTYQKEETFFKHLMMRIPTIIYGVFYWMMISQWERVTLIFNH